MNKTFNSFSFGCRVNQAEKEALDRQLMAKGFAIDSEKPGFFIINTCAVTKKAEREARQMIYRLKKDLPKTSLIITGCAATKWINEKIKVSGVDLIIDNDNKEFAADLIIKRLVAQYNAPAYSGKNTPLIKDKFLHSGRLLVKIQDGCQRFCTFCIVPYLRGLPESKSIKSIVSRIKNQEDSISEVILTAINTQAFGYDSKESFINLVRSVLKDTAVPRLSFGSIHPWSITSGFLDFYRSILPQNRLVNFFHIPLQSGSDKILSLMRRGYTAGEFKEKLNILAKINPLTFIGTDIITGFLEESDLDFENTYNFLKYSPIAKFHVFRFSPREKTAAYYMKKRLKNVPSVIKKKRSQALIKLSTQKYIKFLRSNLNRHSKALVLFDKSNGFQKVLLDNQLPAILKKGEFHPGKIIIVKIDSFENNTLTVFPN
ncbi:hypothetical protein A3D05_01625 [Candidatus Gottesmanbacteria bacterium RIFCSPHIGHO2_02_FULL_40_24]|uniref:Uncharacterized protein n=1 Tax=Candidatus Gottesmanbacteria bacterium RIFCSPHIGHO2_01_FULL_40_15 TaxID=1798376 RepID=A0A1F5YZ85_9BACT|nr:MAG: hypothetical protein A2777_04530 [Candidatus Gottesmanbacteria bacterium RIFCSPHIGHO2_01_FULL_40_15]OGG16366.1 MAG: hypothetical protein A3D05_01625 [Candidatus Gottesmanbacteria bacterium RIFCSPHIGHO2_02_FULL_40_24]OGG23434.1 MAG: hypothetical protein A3E42_00105 [Candidatus Gottesmanbacteria bacterium RIFCSPHIGHO2_12_FULL_40_13]OGG33032.1 MAG: hypothetical protein A3I80_03885 [Candidatus Gottesmanbacteria bacterium RIFCSPLOWO2_02_FULL_40_10]